jgi:hypothetical protein
MSAPADSGPLASLLTNGHTAFAEIADLAASALDRFRRISIKAKRCV